MRQALPELRKRILERGGEQERWNAGAWSLAHPSPWQCTLPLLVLQPKGLGRDQQAYIWIPRERELSPLPAWNSGKRKSPEGLMPTWSSHSRAGIVVNGFGQVEELSYSPTFYGQIWQIGDPEFHTCFSGRRLSSDGLEETWGQVWRAQSMGIITTGAHDRTISSNASIHCRDMGNCIISGGTYRKEKPTLRDQAGWDNIVEANTNLENGNLFLYCQDAM